MFCVTFVHIIHTNLIVDYYIIIIYELHVCKIIDAQVVQYYIITDWLIH